MKFIHKTDPYRVMRGPDGIKLECNANKIVIDDPGQDTPLLVELPSGDTGTYACVSSTGETADGEQLTDAQKEWLNEISEEVDAWLDYQTDLKSQFRL